MSQNITLAGQNYTIPDLGEINWGQNLTDYFVAVPSGVLQTTGGSFSLSAEVDFGAAFGLKSLYYKSRTASPAASGQVRLANTDTISFRNAGDSADLTLGVNGSNQLTFNGVVLESDTLPSGQMFVGDAGSSSTPRTITGAWSMSNLGVASINNDYITNVMVNSAAAIAYSKLNLSSSIVNGDISGSAAIAYSKLNLALSIVNADVSGSAAIAYSKLNLATSIVNADIAVGAAIAWSKMANLTVGNMLYSDASGDVAVSGWTFAATGGGVLQTGVNGEIRFQDAAGGEYVGIVAPASVTTHTYALPIAAGSAGQVLSWQSGGQLQWINAAGGGTINSGTAGRFSYYAASGTTLSDQALLSTDGTNISLASGQLIIPVGTAALPSMTFSSDTDTGIYSAVANRVNVALGGANKYAFDASFLNILSSDVYLASTYKLFLDGGGDTYVFEEAANRITLVTGGTTRLRLDNSGFLNILATDVYVGSTNKIYFDGGGDTYISEVSANQLDFFSGGSQRVSILANGSTSFKKAAKLELPETDTVFNGATGDLAQLIGVSGYWGIRQDTLHGINFDVYNGGSPGTALNITQTGQNLFLSGSAAAPGISFIGDPDTGIYRAGANALAISVGGVAQVIWNGNGQIIQTGYLALQDGTAGSPGLNFVNDPDTGIYRAGANDLGLVAGGTLCVEISSTKAIFNALVLAGDGSASTPAFSFGSDQDTGFYIPGANRLGFSTGGTERWEITSAGDLYATSTGVILNVDGSAAAPSYSFLNDLNTGIYRSASDQIGISTGGNLLMITGVRTASSNTNQNTLNFYNGPIGIATQFDNRSTSNVTTSAVKILDLGTYCVLCMVSGSDGTNTFGDLIFSSYNVATPVVVAARTNGASARTYTQSVGELRLQMASGTYDIMSFMIQQNYGSF